jgi:hypothetical protein
MPDIAHIWGGDLSASATGDLGASDGIEMRRQRILRRLLTAPNEYLWQPDFGAGLPAWVGEVIDIDAITGLIRSQMLLEESVCRSPEPAITITAIANGASVTIAYTDAVTGRPDSLSFDVTP